MSGKRKGLGRGLDALLGIAPGQENDETAMDSRASGALQSQDGSLRHLPIEFLQRGKYQPRRDMHPEALEELAESIRAQGIMQPIVVRPIGPDKYEIIAGERRWRGAQLAGLDTVPVLVRDVEDRAAIAMALIENIQREALNPMEEAHALHRLIEEFQMTHQAVSEAVGRSRAAVSNLLRLLSLNEDVKRLLENGDLEMGHARALLGLEGERQSQAARTVVAKGLSVRETERLVRQLQAGPKPAATPKANPDVRHLEQTLSERLGAKVLIQDSKGKGKLVIHYNSLDELDGILAHLKHE